MKTFSSLRDSVRTIRDYPKPGIMFRDITTLLGNPWAFRRAVDELVQPWAGQRIDKVAGMEARGFILGGAVAHQLSSGFVPIRKKGKLPHSTVSIAYSLEYGVDEMEIHTDAVAKGERVILVDDLIATGGTATGAVKLLQQIGAIDRRRCHIQHHFAAPGLWIRSLGQLQNFRASRLRDADDLHGAVLCFAGDASRLNGVTRAPQCRDDRRSRRCQRA